MSGKSYSFISHSTNMSLPPPLSQHNAGIRGITMNQTRFFSPQETHDLKII